MQFLFFVALAIAVRACSDAAEAGVEPDHVQQSLEKAIGSRVMPVISSASLLGKESRRRFLRTRDVEDDKPVSLSSADEERMKVVLLEDIYKITERLSAPNKPRLRRVAMKKKPKFFEEKKIVISEEEKIKFSQLADEGYSAEKAINEKKIEEKEANKYVLYLLT